MSRAAAKPDRNFLQLQHKSQHRKTAEGDCLLPFDYLFKMRLTSADQSRTEKQRSEKQRSSA